MTEYIKNRIKDFYPDAHADIFEEVEGEKGNRMLVYTVEWDKIDQLGYSRKIHGKVKFDHYKRAEDYAELIIANMRKVI